ncbi:hypothetical protein FHG87_014522 [Trinorchestia longiramus]|nr:hypothetical protein FHG87_014522 [Trinorchestia longiramus]
MSEELDDSAIQDNCLKNRKYWCFLLSSIFTFVVGTFIVLVWRLGEFLFCRHKEATELEVQQQKEKMAQQQKEAGMPPSSAKSMNLMEGNFVTEAKDWAGELISGQTTTGRILRHHCEIYVMPQAVYSLPVTLQHASASSRTCEGCLLSTCDITARKCVKSYMRGTRMVHMVQYRHYAVLSQGTWCCAEVGQIAQGALGQMVQGALGQMVQGALGQMVQGALGQMVQGALQPQHYLLTAQLQRSPEPPEPCSVADGCAALTVTAPLALSTAAAVVCCSSSYSYLSFYSSLTTRSYH